MITNERQYRITKAELAKLREAIKSFDMEKAIASMGDRTLAKAQLQAMQSEDEVLSDQLREYEALRSGAVASFEADSLSALPDLLVRARIAKGLSQRELAEKLNIQEQQIQRYEMEEYASASLRRLVEVSDALGLKISERARLEAEVTGEEAAAGGRELDWDRFPITEMYRRHWFDNFSGTMREAQENAKHLLGEFLIIGRLKPTEALYKKHVRTGSALDQYSLLAWQYRILRLAGRERTATPFRRSRISTAWIQELASLSAAENGPQLAKEHLREAGIALIMEPHLPKTHLDGAAFLYLTERPVVGLTLRYDRLDNFWFVLFHEMAHVLLHFGKRGITRFFDDLEGEPDDIEREADDFASEALIPSAVWEVSLARYLRSADSVRELSQQLGISPAIIAGRIRKEADNFVLLSELVGAGEVRKRFPEVKFGQ